MNLRAGRRRDRRLRKDHLARETRRRPSATPTSPSCCWCSGALGVYIEFTHPGLILPGVAGGILVLLGLSGVVGAAHQLGRRRAVDAGRRAVRPGSEVRLARHAGRGRRGGHGAGRGAAGGRPAPEMRIRLGNGHRASRCRSRSSPCFLLSLVLRARANKVVTGEAGHDRTRSASRTPRSRRAARSSCTESFGTPSVPIPLEAGARVTCYRRRRAQAASGTRVQPERAIQEERPCYRSIHDHCA